MTTIESRKTVTHRRFSTWSIIGLLAAQSVGCTLPVGDSNETQAKGGTASASQPLEVSGEAPPAPPSSDPSVEKDTPTSGGSSRIDKRGWVLWIVAGWCLTGIVAAFKHLYNLEPVQVGEHPVAGGTVYVNPTMAMWLTAEAIYAQRCQDFTDTGVRYQNMANGLPPATRQVYLALAQSAFRNATDCWEQLERDMQGVEDNMDLLASLNP